MGRPPPVPKKKSTGTDIYFPDIIGTLYVFTTADGLGAFSKISAKTNG
jgi:hypothetical protein